VDSNRSIYPEINEVLHDAILSQRDILLCDMPELMLRMKIGSQYSLSDLKEIFNVVLNNVA